MQFGNQENRGGDGTDGTDGRRVAKRGARVFNPLAMSALPKRFFTPDEYLELEGKAEYKSQYVGGEIFAMAGSEPWHVQIMDNLTKALGRRLDDRPCATFSSDMRVQAAEGELSTYPDVSALCGEPRFDDRVRPGSLLNPQVIFEILSPSTEAFDRGEKFVRYRKLPSLSDYVLVASEVMRVEHFVRQGNGAWVLTEYNQPADAVPLGPLDCALPLAEIYRRVTFPGDRPAA